MSKKKIRIKFQNGLNYQTALKEILSYVAHLYEFEESNNPQVIVFGPYGNDIPAFSDRYLRVGYYCENFKPDLSICEWAFGMTREDEVNNPRYKKIQWHNLDPNALIKSNVNLDQILSKKSKFCNFLYSHKVSYREKFFQELSKYKRVDAPGKSMNNMPSIDQTYKGDFWERKKQFLNEYKFTIAFENYSYPGYQTEKLYDAMLSWSIPIYFGDPHVTNIFNSESFVNGAEFTYGTGGVAMKYLERYCQMDFDDLRPDYFSSFKDKVKRKAKTFGRELKMNLQFGFANYNDLVERIVEIDRDERLYTRMLMEPWLKNNTPPTDKDSTHHWIKIFESLND